MNAGEQRSSFHKAIIDTCDDNVASKHICDEENVGEQRATLHQAIIDTDDPDDFQEICDQVKAQADYSSELYELVLHEDRKGTPMMGELPLSVAALTLNTKKVQAILTIDKLCLKGRNSKGDTIIHSLIRYAPYRPDAKNEIIEMITFIYKLARCMDNDSNWKLPKVRSHEETLRLETRIMNQDNEMEKTLVFNLFRKDNSKGFSPLELATRKCVPYIFSCILSLQDVYLQGRRTDGVYLSKLYDISEN